MTVASKHKSEIRGGTYYEFTQNEKIEQIKFETLVVGVDIGKETNYARALDYRGKELRKVLRFSNTREGFQAFDKWINEGLAVTGKTEVIVGFEPTGHYWFSFEDHSKALGHKIAIVNPMHVERTKEFDDNSPTKKPKHVPSKMQARQGGIPLGSGSGTACT